MSQKRDLPPRPKKEARPKVEDVKENSEEESLTNVEDVAEETPRKRGPRGKPTMEDHVANYNKLFSLLDEEIDRKAREKEKGAKVLRSMRKTLVKMRKELPKVTRSKAARLYSSTRRNRGGITIKSSISDELCEFLQLPKNSQIARVDATRAICVYSHLKDDETREEILKWNYLNPNKRDLQNKKDKRAIVPDPKLSKLLKYKRYQQNVSNGKIMKKTKDPESGQVTEVPETSDLLYYYTIQRLLSPHFLKSDPTLNV